MCLTSGPDDMGIDRRRASALAAALAAVLAGACGRTELWPALEVTGYGGSDGGTDVPAAASDASPSDGGGDAVRSHDPCSAAGTPCGADQHCLPTQFRRASSIPGGPDLDLAVSRLDPSDAVALLLGNGDGTFGAPILVPGGGGLDIATADFDGDQHADLAVATTTSVRVLFGDGHGRFSAPIAAAETGLWTVLAGADGRRDHPLRGGRRFRRRRAPRRRLRQRLVGRDGIGAGKRQRNLSPDAAIPRARQLLGYQRDRSEQGRTSRRGRHHERTAVPGPWQVGIYLGSAPYECR